MFRPPTPIRQWSRIQKCMLFTILGLVAGVFLVAYRTATIAALQHSSSTGKVGFSCEDVGTISKSVKVPDKFTMVLLGHLALPDKDLRTSLRAIRQNVEPGDNIVIGLRKKRKFEHMINIVQEELRPLVNQTAIKVCESTHIHEAWRELWKRKFIAKDFVIFDQLAMLTSSWRDWVQQMKKKNPKSILSLQQANDRFVVGTDSNSQFKISSLPSFGALIPPNQVWNEFLNWFDKEPEQYNRVAGARLPKDVPDDGWEFQALGHHGGWTKPFAQFIARTKYKVLHAYPRLAYSIYEQQGMA